MDKYPPFPRGFSHFIGADIVDDLSIAFAYTKNENFPDDVLFGILCFKLDITMVNVTTMYNHGYYDLLNPDKKPAMVAHENYFNS